MLILFWIIADCFSTKIPFICALWLAITMRFELLERFGWRWLLEGCQTGLDGQKSFLKVAKFAFEVVCSLYLGVSVGRTVLTFWEHWKVLWTLPAILTLMVIIASLPRRRPWNYPVVAFRLHVMLVTVSVALLIASCQGLVKNDTPLGLLLAVVVRVYR